MTRFDRYFLGQLIAVFGVSSVVLVLIYWINRAVRLFDWLIASGQTATVFLEFTALSLPNVIRLVIPISAFASSVYVANRLSSESELVVVQATGYGPARLARSVWVFGFFVAAFMSVLTHFVVPFSLTRLADREIEVSDNVTAQLLQPGQFIHPSDGVTFYVRDIDANGVLQDLFLRDAREEENHITYTAETAKLVRSDAGPRLVMYEGAAQTLSVSNASISVTRFRDLTFDIASALEGLRNSDRGKRDRRERWTHELLFPTEEVLATTSAKPKRMRIEAHRRFTQAIFALTAPVIGFATLLLGGFSRFGVWQQILGAIALLVVLQILDNAATGFALRNPSAWPVVYVPAFLSFGIAVSILAVASNPGWYRRRPDRGAAT